MSKIPKFEGHDVIRSACKITKAGDGLSDALRLDPTALHLDDDVYFILRGKVTQINHVPTGPADETLQRVHTIVTQEITRVDEDLADPILRDAASRLEEAKRAATGQDPIPGTGVEDLEGQAGTTGAVPIGQGKPGRARRTRKAAAKKTDGE